MFSFNGFLRRNDGYHWAGKALSWGILAGLGRDSGPRPPRWPWPFLSKADVNKIAGEVMGGAKRGTRAEAVPLMRNKVCPQPAMTSWHAAHSVNRPAATRSNGGLRGSTATRWSRR